VVAGANNYVHPASHAATIITQSVTHRFVLDTEKATWNGKADINSPNFTETPKAPTRILRIVPLGLLPQLL